MSFLVVDKPKPPPRPNPQNRFEVQFGLSYPVRYATLPSRVRSCEQSTRSSNAPVTGHIHYIELAVSLMDGKFKRI